MINKRYLRKLKRTDPAKAEAYIRKKTEEARIEEAKPIIKPLDKRWYKRGRNWVKNGEVLEDYEEGAEPVEAPIKVGDYYLTVGHFMYLHKTLTKLKQERDLEALWAMQDELLVPFSEIMKVDIDRIIEAWFAEKDESSFDAEQF